MIRKAFRSLFAGDSSSISDKEIDQVNKALAKTKLRMGSHYKNNQILGRKEAIGCVSLEISQRCNLDCSLCYLSASSNQVVDLPLQEVFRRLDGIKQHYGVGTDVQVSGGDPTMRDRNELMQIVRYAREIGLNPTLFTNGIRCDRNMVEELVMNGLSDIAFHVDLTQGRKGFATEQELNKIRRQYIDMVRGLPLMVIFNTTVHTDNFSQIPDLVRFFIGQADVVRFASFQLQADTGRGVLGKRGEVISLETVREKINEGSGNPLAWDSVLVGHPKCHSYTPALAVNNKAFSLIDDPELVGDFFNDFQNVGHDRRERPGIILMKYLKEMLRRPRWLLRVLKYFIPRLWKIRWDLLAAKGKAHKISFFVQNFMDADHLDLERIEACSFMVMTSEGPVSMCAHNAKRDDYILQPLSVEGEHGPEIFYPLKDPERMELNALRV